MGYCLLGLFIVQSDISRRKIPNKLLLLLLATGAMSHLLASSSILWPMTLCICTFFIGYFLFKFNILGAGDGKFIAVSMFYFAYYPIAPQILSIALIGGVYAIGIYVTRWIKHKNFREALKESKLKTIPYGVPIYLGSILGVVIGGLS